MSAREWKPGDVALIEVGCHANRRVAIRTGVPSNMGWAYSDTRDGKSTRSWIADTHGTIRFVRPLVVIDPEDREQVRNLLATYGRQFTDWTPELDSNVTRLQAALREFANPAPPKPDEPTGLGAVVEDADGERWVRVNQRTGTQEWRSCDYNGAFRNYAAIDAVRKLSDGVTEDGAR